MIELEDEMSFKDMMDYYLECPHISERLMRGNIFVRVDAMKEHVREMLDQLAKANAGAISLTPLEIVAIRFLIYHIEEKYDYEYKSDQNLFVRRNK